MLDCSLNNLFPPWPDKMGFVLLKKLFVVLYLMLKIMFCFWCVCMLCYIVCLCSSVSHGGGAWAFVAAWEKQDILYIPHINNWVFPLCFPMFAFPLPCSEQMACLFCCICYRAISRCLPSVARAYSLQWHLFECSIQSEDHVLPAWEGAWL